MHADYWLPLSRQPLAFAVELAELLRRALALAGKPAARELRGIRSLDWQADQLDRLPGQLTAWIQRAILTMHRRHHQDTGSRVPVITLADIADYKSRYGIALYRQARIQGAAETATFWDVSELFGDSDLADFREVRPEPLPMTKLPAYAGQLSQAVETVKPGGVLPPITI